MTISNVDPIQEVLMGGFRNPAVVPTSALIKTGLSYHEDGDNTSFSAQTALIKEHRPQHLEEYFQGLLDAGVPQADVDRQRAATS